MKKNIIIAIIMALMIAIGYQSASAQQAQANTQAAQQEIIITPSMPIGYVVFAINALNTIQIQGSEVNLFISAKEILEKEVNRCAELKMKNSDITKFDIAATKAQNIVDFLQRAKLTGAEAGLYKGFIDALIDAAREAGKKKK